MNTDAGVSGQAACALMTCDRVFKPSKHGQKYCSDKCRKAAYVVRKLATDAAFENVLCNPPHNADTEKVRTLAYRLGTEKLRKILRMWDLSYIESEGVWK